MYQNQQLPKNLAPKVSMGQTLTLVVCLFLSLSQLNLEKYNEDHCNKRSL